MVIGVRVTDGRFRWATNLRNDDFPSNRDRRSFFARPTANTERSSFQPLLADGQIYWSAQQSDQIYCISTGTGRIQWAMSRSVESGGTLEGSQDRYAAGTVNNRLVLVGDRHIRAVDIENGHQLWVTYLPPQTGKATFNDKVCLVPLLNGTVAYIDHQTGTMNSISQSYLSESGEDFVGSLVADDNFVFAATPLSITAFPTHNNAGLSSSGNALTNANADKAADNSPARWTPLQNAESAILSGNISEAVDGLQSLIDQNGSHSETVRAQQILANLLLHSLAQEKFTTTDENRTSSQTSPPTGFARQLSHLPLTSEQSLRLSILSGNTMPATFQNNHRELLDILPNWTVRADVAANADFSERKAERTSPINLDNTSLLQTAEGAILFPEQIGQLSEQLAFANRLAKQGFDAAAELFLLSASRNSSDSDRSPFNERLAALRTRYHQQNPEPPTSSQVIETLRVKEHLHLHSNNRIAELLNASYVPVDCPDWYPDRLIFGNLKLHVANMDTGAVSTPLTLPTRPSRFLANTNWDAPGLLPIVGQRSVGMISLLTPNGPRILWRRPFPRQEFDITALETGPFGADYMIIATAHQITCLHPLTGSTLWTRHITTGAHKRGLFSQSLRFAGDEHVIGVFGQNMKSCEVYRTTDGLSLGAIPIDIPTGSTPIISGRRILFQRDHQLHLVDLLERRDVLASEPVPKLFRTGTAKVISGHRIVMISEDREIVLLDTQSGKIAWTCPVAKDLAESGLTERLLTGLTAFERDGRLYVLVKNAINPYSRQSSSSRMGEIHLPDGVLFCIDPKTGKRIWNHLNTPAVFPKVNGDMIDMLVKWSWTDSSSNPFEHRVRRDGFGSNSSNNERSLSVAVIDAKSGKTLIEKHNLSADEPVRCVHNADTETITLQSATSEIHLLYGQHESSDSETHSTDRLQK